jgi:hypothetical protein
MSSESLPKWVAEEIRNAKFDSEEEWSGSGYILDINKEERKIDVQFYEKLPEGRYIATLDLPEKSDPESLELAVVYMFKFKSLKAPLDAKVVAFLKEKFDLNMDAVYKFELQSVEKLEDVAADRPPPQASEDTDEDGE